ncbi:IS1 family transposase [Klebsiella pneumoniae]|nr:IS1 family transposase [Klebsiella pneumoniae]
MTSLFARNGRTVVTVGAKSRQRWLFYAYEQDTEDGCGARLR